MRGYFAEGRTWNEDFLQRAARGDPGAEDRTRARALFGAGILTFGHGDLLRSITLLEEGLATYRKLGDQPGTAATVATLGYVRRAQGDGERRS